MTIRERGIGVGFIALLALLPALGLWQQARYRKAERATQAFIEAQQRAETSEPGAAALFRQAQPQVRRNLLAGDFDAALQRLTALQDEGETPSTNKAHGKPLALNEVWLPHTPARATAQQVLRLMARKQAQGYDLSGAQEALLQVANAARQGDKQQALAAFTTVAALTRTAMLRPGFGTASSKAPVMPNGLPNPPLTAPPGANPQRLAQLRRFAAQSGMPRPTGQLPPVTPGQMQQLEQSIQTFQLVLPQLMERAAPEQKLLLQRLTPFLNALLAAYHAGQDIRPVMPFLQQIMVVGKRNPNAAAHLLDGAWAALNTAKPLLLSTAKVATVSRAHFPHPPARLPVPPAKLANPLSPPPPQLPANHAPSRTMTTPPQSQRILQMLDVIRKLPEPVYQQQRPQIARYINGALANMGGSKNTLAQSAIQHAPRQFPQRSAPLRPTAAPPPHTMSEIPSPLATALGVGTPAKLRLNFNATGQIIGLWGLGHDLAPGLAPGGLTLQTGDALPAALHGTPKGDSATITTNLTGLNHPHDANCSIRYEAAGRDLTIHLKTQRNVAGAPAMLVLRIPLQAAGWHWDTGTAAQVIAVDGTYAMIADGGDKLPMITLRGTTMRLAILAPTATAIAYDPVVGALALRFAIPSAPGGAEHTVSFTISH